MLVQVVNIRTQAVEEAVDVTVPVAEALSRTGLTDGAVLVFCPHTTAGVVVNEHADPSVMADIKTVLGTLAKSDDPRYRHQEGNSHAHAKAILTGNSLLLPVAGGRLKLGTWQGIFFLEFDGPRDRQLYIQFLAAGGLK